MAEAKRVRAPAGLFGGKAGDLSACFAIIAAPGQLNILSRKKKRAQFTMIF
jgi:hypothetical protein